MMSYMNVLILLAIALGVQAQTLEETLCVGQEDDTYVADPDHCDGYYWCSGEWGTEQICENGEQWMADESYCNPDYPNCWETETPIDVAPETPAPAVPTNPPVNGPVTPAPPTNPGDDSFVCPTNQPNQVSFHPSVDCGKYFICFNGQRMAMSCLAGHHWNNVARQCDIPILAQCATYADREPITNLPLCPRFSDAFFAHPDDCSRFIYCEAGFRTFQNCPIGFGWDTQTNRCMIRSMANCFNANRLQPIA